MNRWTATGAALVGGLLILALLGDGLSPYRFDEQDALHVLEGPGAAHPLGTDALGRDLLARVAEGARISLVLALGSTSFALVLGVVYGAISGYAGGRTE